MMMTLNGAEQRPFARDSVDRRHSITEMAADVTRCFWPELMQC